jgi:hypothetical protein
VLRPPSTGGDASIERRDIAVFRRLALLGARITGFPAKAIHEYHAVFGQPCELWGHFPDWGYKGLGLLTFEIELGVLWNSLGYATDDIFRFTPQDCREAERKQMAWHDAHPEEGAFVDWRPFRHPQLGPVEIGGWTPTGRANIAPADRIGAWDGCRRFVFELAARAPRLEISRVAVAAVAPRVLKLSCRVANEGYLPTSVTRTGAGVEGVDGVVVELERTRGVSFVSGRNHVRLGHLDAGACRDLDWVLAVPAAGAPAVTLTAHAARSGRKTVRVALQ